MNPYYKAKYPHLFKDPDVSLWKLFRDDAIPGQEPYTSMVQRIARALAVVKTRSQDTLPIIFG